jgi:hypothetical protein
MPRLIKYIVCGFAALILGSKSYAQFRMRVPVERRVIAQPPARRLEMIKEAFLERRLNLTPEQSKAFWPLYHQYVQDQTAVRIAKKDNLQQTQTNGSQQAVNELQYETELVNIRKHYLDEFMKILPPEKVSLLYKSEHDFNEEVVRQLSERGVQPAN